MKILNMAPWVREKKYIVFRMVDNVAWFYDAWDDIDKAVQQAVEVGGLIIPSTDAERG